MRASSVWTVAILLPAFLSPILLQAQKRTGLPAAKPTVVAANDHVAAYRINDLFDIVTNTGSGGYNSNWGNSGFYFPAESGSSLMYKKGFFWGGYHMGRPTPKVGGSDFRTGLQAGRILASGTAVAAGVYRPNCVSDNPGLAKYRVFKVRPDVRPGIPISAVVAQMEEEAALINKYGGSATGQGLYDQYVLDWNEWPGNGSPTDAAGLAPFSDLNGDGLYQAAADIPGQPGANVTLYYVANDNDSVRAIAMAGSPPIGIEMHRTIWGYARRGFPENVIYNSTKLINKSGYRVDSMYVAEWGDVDLGEASNDFMACDTALNLGYAYNSASWDYVFGGIPPAYGLVLLSGPAVRTAPSDSAIVGLRYRRGYRNLPMTAFALVTDSYPRFTDPRQGAGGDLPHYCFLRGRIPSDCAPYIDSTTLLPTLFPFAGDPVRGTGFTHETYDRRSGDWRLLVSSGPFSFADGDTQEIVSAQIAARGMDRLGSVVEMKELAGAVIRGYRDLLAPQPIVSAVVRYPAASTAEVQVSADLGGLTSAGARAFLRRRDGSIAAALPLFDDGAHSDSAANDGYAAGSAQIPVEPFPFSIDCEITHSSGTTTLYERVVEEITVSGLLRIDDIPIVSDNLNDDRRADAYEDVRYGITLSNATPFTLRDLIIRPSGDIAHFVPSLGPGEQFVPHYDPLQAGSYFSREMPATSIADTLSIPVGVWDANGNAWVDTVHIPVRPRRYAPSTGHALHLSGWSDGNFDIMVTDRLALKNHRYVIRAASSDSAGGIPTITLEDSTEGRILFTHHTIPDQLGHTVPVTDGFKVTQGDVILPGSGHVSVKTSVGTSPWAFAGGPVSLPLEAFGGTVGRGSIYWPSGGTPDEGMKDVLIRFVAFDSTGRITNPSDTNISFAHRYLAHADYPPAQPSFSPYLVRTGPGFAFQDYVHNLPFAAYDINATPPRRLMVGYLENNVPAGMVNGRYWPPRKGVGIPPADDNVSEVGPREWFFVFDLMYRESPDPSLQVDIQGTSTPLMWFGRPPRSAFVSMGAGKTFTIHFPHPPATGDAWSFNPVDVIGGIDKTIPDQFHLFPNYPNPFNAGTTIKYGLPADSRVVLRIYNILGQEVRTLFDELQLEGYRTVRWDGRNNAGAPVATGVYIYRLQGGTTDASPREFVSAGKMIVVR